MTSRKLNNVCELPINVMKNIRREKYQLILVNDHHCNLKLLSYHAEYSTNWRVATTVYLVRVTMTSFYLFHCRFHHLLCEPIILVCLLHLPVAQDPNSSVSPHLVDDSCSPGSSSSVEKLCSIPPVSLFVDTSCSPVFISLCE